MKVLLSAFACGPGIGSEPEVGLQMMLTAARRHEVWVLTQRPMADAVRQFLKGHWAAERVHLVPVDPPVPPPRGGLWELMLSYWQHDRWQRRAAHAATVLDRRVDFDVVHHVTFAAYWMRTGVAAVGKPLVWGPVGGGVEPPLALLSQLGGRGLLEAAARTTTRRIAGSTTGVRSAQRAATVVFTQNTATARRIRSPAEVIVLSNALQVDLGSVLARGPRTKDVAVVGRLLPWKGIRLAVRAMRYVTHDGAVLRIYGDGPERRPTLALVRRWALQDRVALEGPTPRQRLLDEVARAGALLHPSLHEEGGTAVAEALAIGTPVICLRHGGPGELLDQWPSSPSVAIEPSWPDATARAFAAAIDRYLADPPPMLAHPSRPRDSFDEILLGAYERAAALGKRPGSSPVE
jgi:glycosyltransferase involved in cell wall biosynthesis